MDIKATAIFEKNYEAILGDKRFIINEGGSRSSKTYSLCQLMIIYCLQNNNKVVVSNTQDLPCPQSYSAQRLHRDTQRDRAV
jgi:hypothetical protein